MSFPDAKRSAKTMGAVLDEELAEDVAPDVRAMANAIVAAHGGSVAAVLFYGSCLRDSSTAGVLDFYVLVDDYRAYHRRAMPALFNFLLPPTVSQWRIRGSSGPLRAKVAVISRAQFRRRMNARNLDTSLWIRFCQPCALVYRRDTETADWVVETLGQAISTAAEWAVRLGPAEGEPGSYWRALFRNSYRAELRVERSADRGATIYEAAAARYDRLLLPALRRTGIRVQSAAAGQVRPFCRHRGTAAAWFLRCAVGKTLTLARLVKASFTFNDGVDYIVWKIERHSGRPLTLSPWQRRHPLLSAPAVLWRLWRSKTIR